MRANRPDRGSACALTIEREVAVPVRDGTVLKADIFRPKSSGPLPAVLVRTPYGKRTLQVSSVDWVKAVEAGFAVVQQDVRGTGTSEGVFYPFLHEAQDGYDTVEWVASQPWCDGNVGMSGGSYFGATQLLAAVESPPHLRAIAPFATASEYYEGWTYQGGAFQLGFALQWVLGALAPEEARRREKAGQLGTVCANDLTREVGNLEDHYRHLPLLGLSILRNGKIAEYYFEWISHSSRDDYWTSVAINSRYRQVRVPALHFGGWYDPFLKGTIENFVCLRKEAGSEEARSSQHLVIGPWAHGDLSGTFPEHNFGGHASLEALDLNALQLRFFAKHLRRDDPNEEGDPPVRLFVMGENTWRDEEDWPPRGTRNVDWFLHSDGRAGSVGGSLSRRAPRREQSDSYLYDPRDPVPTVGGPTSLPGFAVSANAGPRDQRGVERRPDVLVYTSSPLPEPMEVTGHLTVRLHASSSARDTDFVARLMDVYPDGRSVLLAEGIVRARFRDGYESPDFIEPDTVYEYTIDLVATSNVFAPGHRVRVIITSSSFPRFDANANTGNAIGKDGPEDLRLALQTVFHDHEHPSRVSLPVVWR